MSLDELKTMKSKKAKEEREAQVEMAREAHNEIFGKKIGEQALMAEEEPNWALYNYIMQIVDMRDCKNMQQALHKMYRNLWPHIKKYHNDREYCIKIIEKSPCTEGSIDDLGMAPVTMATKALQAVSDAAKKRSKSGIYVPKRKKLEVVR